MTEQFDPSRQLVELFANDIQVGGDPEIPDEEFMFRPHSELLENTFQALYASYKSGDTKAYHKSEADFVRRFEQFWRYRIQSYQATDSAGLRERRYVRVGANTEEMGITQTLILDPDEDDQLSGVKIHIFRAEPGGESWDSVDLQGFPITTENGGFYTTVNLDTTINRQEYPLPVKFHLELKNKSIASFQRTTVRYYNDEQGKPHALSNTENIGYTSIR